jgi:hypothetical protein
MMCHSYKEVFRSKFSNLSQRLRKSFLKLTLGGAMSTFYNDLVFTEALEQVEAIMTTQSSDEIANRLENIVSYPDLAHVCLMLLIMRAKGVDTANMNGVELANTKPTIADLILPPGVTI